MTARRFTAHRALPLDVVEANARAARVAWVDEDPAAVARADARAAATIARLYPNCNGACEAGRSQCNCPTEAGSAVSDLLADPPKLRPPAVPWGELMAGLLVVLFVVSVVHVVANVFPPSVQVAAK